MNNIHQTAIVDDSATLGNNITIEAFTVIGKDVCIGDGTVIKSHTLIEGKTTIGKNNRIFSHAVIGSIPQDLKYDGEDVEIIIGDNNTIREHTLVNPGTKGGGSVTKIGHGCLLMGHVHIGHDCILSDNIVIANSCAIAGHVEIASNVVVGGMSAIHQFCKIGENAMIGGGSILVQDIPPFCICEGNRATLRSLNINGLRRKFSKERNNIDEIKKAYKLLFDGSKSLKESAQEILNTNKNKYVIQLADFVLKTKRGIPLTRK